MRILAASLAALLCASCGSSSVSSTSPSAAVPVNTVSQVTTRSTSFHTVSPDTVSMASGADYGQRSAATVAFSIVNDASGPLSVVNATYTLIVNGATATGTTIANPFIESTVTSVAVGASAQKTHTQAWSQTGAAILQVSVIARANGGGTEFVTFKVNLAP